MESIFLSLGSNLGDRYERLQQAINQLHKNIGEVVTISPVYETEPWKMTSSHSFLNACVKLKSSLSPIALLQEIQQIECDAGRQKNNSNGYEDRLLDIDIIFYGNLNVNLPNLTIPHPHFSMRKFVLLPLFDIADDFDLNQLNLSRLLLIKSCPDKTPIHRTEKSLVIPY
jgi:2-amino-4-hydroxy-6-hydroxymethyldihydropteridine diphosphokinase